MSKVAETKTRTDKDEIEELELAKMMILPRDQDRAFLPDDDIKDLSGFGRRPVRYLTHADQTTRTVNVVLPPGIVSFRDIHERPRIFHRIQTQDAKLRLRVLDRVTFFAHDFSWCHFGLVTSASDDRVVLKPDGTEVRLDWGPSQAAKEAA
jgi:hypothetical protein